MDSTLQLLDSAPLTDFSLDSALDILILSGTTLSSQLGTRHCYLGDTLYDSSSFPLLSDTLYDISLV